MFVFSNRTYNNNINKVMMVRILSSLCQLLRNFSPQTVELFVFLSLLCLQLCRLPLIIIFSKLVKGGGVRSQTRRRRRDRKNNNNYADAVFYHEGRGEILYY